MAVTSLFVTMLLANTAPMVASQVAQQERTDITTQDVAYHEMQSGQPEAAIAKMESSKLLVSRDPAALINMGSAYAQMGKTEKALDYYRAAMQSTVRYDLELADGRWMDSRRAAQVAYNSLAKHNTQAMREAR